MIYQCGKRISVAYFEYFKRYGELKFKNRPKFMCRYALFLKARSQMPNSSLKFSTVLYGIIHM